MKLIKKGQTKEFANADTCVAIEYPMGLKDLNGAVIYVKGRYPEKGRVTNNKCKELAYVIEGNGKVVIEGETILLHKEDLLLLEPGEKYYWDGELKMFMSCSPAWYPEQHKEVD